MQDMKFALLKHNIWLSARLLKVVILRKSQIKYCFWRWLPNVGLTSQQQPYSRLKLPHNPDDHIPPTFEMTPRLKPSTVKKKLKFASHCTFTTQSACFYLLRGFGIHGWFVKYEPRKRLYRYKTTHPDVDRPLHLGLAARWTSENLHLLSFS